MPDNYEYDVFVSYCGVNRKMVQDDFITPLKAEKLKVTWDLDFKSGYTTHSIAEKIISSKYVLCIVTKEYLEADKGWILFEEALTFTEASDKRIKGKIIPILYVDRDNDLTDRHATLKICNPIFANDTTKDMLIKQIMDWVWEKTGPAFEFSSGGRALAIGSHWDDILLGCLGTLIKLKETRGYEVDIFVLCDQYSKIYYGTPQHGLDKTVTEFYHSLRNECGFRYIEIPSPNLVDREFRMNSDKVEAKIAELIKELLDKSNKNRPCNLVFCPPIDDKNSDHALTGEIVFEKFRSKNYTILEYVIKRYTESSFIPNVCISLDDNIEKNEKWKKYVEIWRKNLVCSKLLQKAIKGEGNIEELYKFLKENMASTQSILTQFENFRVSDAKVCCIDNICQVTEKIKNSDRLFSPDALRARMQMNALDYGKRFDVKHAEVFRGRIDL